VPRHQHVRDCRDWGARGLIFRLPRKRGLEPTGKYGACLSKERGKKEEAVRPNEINGTVVASGNADENQALYSGLLELRDDGAAISQDCCFVLFLERKKGGP